jgi:GT2 family glycosyltransferase
MESDYSQTVSIIIPSLNSPIIDLVVVAIESQPEIDSVAEIVVVGKDEFGLLQSGERVRLIDTGNPVLPGTARNMGIRATAGSLLIFLDSDCLPQPGWLGAHLSAQRDSHPVVGGSVLPDGDNYWSLSYNLAMFYAYLSTAVSESRSYLPTLNLSVSRHVIDSVGLLDESLPRSQDLDWTVRMKQAGFLPYFAAEATVQHRHNRTTIRKVWQDCARSGYYARQVRIQHHETLGTSVLLRFRLLILLLSPFIATWVTGRIFLKQTPVLLYRFYTLPAIFLTKVAWCWGASRLFDKAKAN